MKFIEYLFILFGFIKSVELDFFSYHDPQKYNTFCA